MDNGARLVDERDKSADETTGPPRSLRRRPRLTWVYRVAALFRRIGRVGVRLVVYKGSVIERMNETARKNYGMRTVRHCVLMM